MNFPILKMTSEKPILVQNLVTTGKNLLKIDIVPNMWLARFLCYLPNKRENLDNVILDI